MRLLIAVAASTFALSALAADDPVSRLGLINGDYCSPEGLRITVAAPHYLGIMMVHCKDPKLANGMLTASHCLSMAERRVTFEATFRAAGDTIVSDGRTYKLAPERKDLQSCQVASETITKAAVEEEPEPVMTIGHNGSGMQIGMDDKIIYVTPKASIRDVVKSGTVLVDGKWVGEQYERYEGTAYAFKKGCAPAPYKVSGGKVEKPGQIDIVLRGAGPIRQGCEVVGYSDKSPHSRLVFDRLMSN